jgi:ABC-type dipeptide/oligopeptide/nickel transport system permease component
MATYILRRLFYFIPVMLAVSFLVFAIAEITPGDPVLIMLGNRATPERIAEIRATLHLDDPFLIRYGRFVWNALRGDLGTSIRGRTPVLDEILTRLPSTFELTLAAVIVVALTGVPAGFIAAKFHNSLLDRGITFFSVVGLSMPSIWLAVILILIFGLQLKWVSVTQGEGLRDLILPAITLGLAPAASLARLTRSAVLEVQGESYVRTARAKGLTPFWVDYRHVLPNALIPLVTYLGLLFADLLGGAVFIEAVFVRPGIGRFAVNAIAARDFPQIQGLVLFLAFFYLALNLLVDLLYGVIDPRIRYK